MRKISSLFLAAFVLLSSSTASANDPEMMRLYRKALEGMDWPLRRDDFESVGLKTARDFDALAQMCIEAGDYARAQELTAEALELDAFDPVANLNAGLLYYKYEKYQEAVYHLSWALRIEENLYKTRRVHLGEELLSTSEPPAYLPIMTLLDKAREKAGMKPEADETGGKRPPELSGGAIRSDTAGPAYEILREVDEPGKVRKLDILVPPDTTKGDALELARDLMAQYENYAIVNVKIFDDKDVYNNRGGSQELKETFWEHFLVDAVKNKYIGADWVKWIAEGRN
ncbi:MAG: hypothetical protein A3C38_07920 [Planctomycetes bacterium RIFCSPHIGHO2_02_FULL_50_42]|nr:MAG: hypothetical protein A2060_06365 [Planctomycetes bacterium GWA2_50_13]OHB87346.1 MAG: hypothetical protein A3C38_07920 [Planctomycetes bacterium RIFCSPHIGHO2_02_FULL_50_42]OHB94782.1 MAG: hypothetical protein A3I59_02480 [Planctomycetes bacterium RIFCSPLOWO2_02_FULL_50_16]OHC02544.1 MAG: hypothetical protein A3G17_01330 [Planctomycetes bacterium RIFCSPLOWO2_12_FULL_50_35]HCN18990.1 hypothetical protein [Planctomycetia bacterium]